MRQQQRCQCKKMDDANAEKDQDNGAANHKSKDSEAEMTTSDTGNIDKAKTTTNENEREQNGRDAIKQTAAKAEPQTLNNAARIQARILYITCKRRQVSRAAVNKS